jgi:hypothetical protein
MGRSRRGLMTKIRCPRRREWQGHDSRSAAHMLDGLGPGHIHLADRAYDSNARRQGHD